MVAEEAVSGKLPDFAETDARNPSEPVVLERIPCGESRTMHQGKTGKPSAIEGNLGERFSLETFFFPSNTGFCLTSARDTAGTARHVSREALSSALKVLLVLAR